MTSHAQSAHTSTKSDNTTPAILAFGVGLAMLIAAFATLDYVPGWAEDYGTILVYLAFFLYMSIAGRLTWWGIDALYARLRHGRGRR
ncbi:hypothetical protein [Nocardia brasiliensis]